LKCITTQLSRNPYSILKAHLFWEDSTMTNQVGGLFARLLAGVGQTLTVAA